MQFSLEGRELFCSRISSFSWISMEGFFTEKPNTKSIESPTKCEQIDLTLKLSPCGQNAEEKWLTMGEEKPKSTVENEAHEGPFVLCLDRYCSVPAEGEQGLMRFGDLQTMRRVRTGKRLLLQKQRRAAAAEADKSKLKTLPNPFGDSSHQAILKEMTESPSDSKLESTAKKSKHVNHCLKGDAMNILRQMPRVSVTGDGPNGKRIEGVVYKYCGGQVCIVCFCHGSFLSPAEFVMHAGGKEVANPIP